MCDSMKQFLQVPWFRVGHFGRPVGIDLRHSGDNHGRGAGDATNSQIYDDPIPNWPRSRAFTVTLVQIKR